MKDNKIKRNNEDQEGTLVKGGVKVETLLPGNEKEEIKEIIKIFKSLTREEKEVCLTKLLNLGL